MLTINCWQRSGNDRGIFQVTILKTNTVCDLQDAIKNEKAATFRDVDAGDLALYKPKHVSRPYTQSLSNLILSEHGERLLELHELSEVFPEQPPKLDIHVIIDAPPTISCWLRGSSLIDRFLISIQPGEDIDLVSIPRIKDTQPDLRSVADQHIRLYKISGDDNELRLSLNKTGDGELLQGDILPHFLDVPVLAPLRVVVEISASARLTNPHLFLHSGFGVAHPIASAREDFIQARPQNKSPSNSSEPSVFRETQRMPHTQIPCGRPRGPEELIPVTLLHPVFGQFEDDCHTGTT